MSFNYEYTFYVGTFDKATHQRELTEARLMETIERILCDEVYTIVDGVGKYRHTNGEIISEPSKIITIFAYQNYDYSMQCYAKRLANALNQESVLLKCANVNASLVFNNDMEG